jgi:predicted acyltransferase
MTSQNRLASADIYRGFVMLLMMAEVLHFGDVSKALPIALSGLFLGHHQDHVEWVGCALHDLIQPSFSFLVGVVLPYSVANRLSKGGF